MHSQNITHCTKCGVNTLSTEKTNCQSQGMFNVHHWHKHKHASMLAISHLRHQSATASTSPHMQQTLSQLINVMNVTVTSYLRHMQNK